MARHYVIQDWSNSATWSGEMIGDRLSKSKGHHFLKNGMANTEMYAGDEEDGNKRKTSVPLKSRILPQAARLEKLTAEIIELEEANRKGEFTPAEYTLLRSVAFRKLHRAEELLKKAITPIVKEEETEEDSAQDSVEYTPSSGFRPQPNDAYASKEYEAVGVVFIDSLSSQNMFKSFLKNTCIITRKVIHYKHKISSYLQTLKEV